MKKMKKLNLNKVRIVSLKNLHIVRGGGATAVACVDTHACQDPTATTDPNTCYSTSNTHQDGSDGGGTFASDPNTQTCSAVLTECELAGR